MSNRIPVFWLEPTDTVRVSLRRYRRGAANDCPGEYKYHNASVDIGEAPARFKSGDRGDRYLEALPEIPHDDPRFPRACGCGYVFAADDHWQTNQELLYRAAGGGRDGSLFTLRDAPAGAMWDAWWMPDWEKGPDGICLVVKTPCGDWMVDSEASNCTRTQWHPVEGKPNSRRWAGRTHYCWVRHGDPRNPSTVHVDKNGNTCAAGAGSILAGRYHGFLHHGHLTNA